MQFTDEEARRLTEEFINNHNVMEQAESTESLGMVAVAGRQTNN
jgi:hypothetical protein